MMQKKIRMYGMLSAFLYCGMASAQQQQQQHTVEMIPFGNMDQWVWKRSLVLNFTSVMRRSSAVRWERRYLLMRNVKAVRRKRDEATGLKHLYRCFRPIFTGRGCGQFVDHSLFIRVFAGFKLVFIGPIKEFFVGDFRVIVISH